MATTEARPHGRVITGRIGDPQEGVRQPEPIVLPDAAWLFSRTADRLVALADGHVMGDWLRFMARLARAQQAAVTAMPPVAPSAVADAVAACMPPLAAGAHRRDPAWRSGLAALLDRPGEDALPAQAVEVIAWLRRADAAALEELADGYLGGRPPGGQAGAALYVAASLQAYFSRLAASLPVDQLRLLPQRGRCPVCGAAPVAGVITAAGNAPGVRYLRCGLCATEWNHVRAVCIGCGESGGLALHAIDGSDGAVKAETCDACRGYAKMLYQASDMQVDPIADDLASLGLDLLVSEAGWSRHAPNPLVLSG
ncbi:MAG TPA: formate dehydrogenase accessory protein FdhE [Acetobacteraceae bacterium]|jgi:FdhE protein|nr:formate dehydrogenase accessory protein FdhE [Acetobacteraceae bacterium]